MRCRNGMTGLLFLVLLVLESYCRECSITRKYQEHPSHQPPILYTFPGSGNTWCRLLIEWSTGIYSGSFYTDRSLFQALPGEDKCDNTLSVVKAHPNLHPFQNISRGEVPTKCKAWLGPIIRAMLLVRNPFDAIWSELQRRVTGSHVKKVSNSHRLAHRKWNGVRVYLSERFRDMLTFDYPQISQEGYVITVKYENLKNESLRISELRRIVEFTNCSDDFAGLTEEAKMERLQCAFTLANHPSVNRASSAGNTGLRTRRGKKATANKKTSPRSQVNLKMKGKPSVELVHGQQRVLQSSHAAVEEEGRGKRQRDSAPRLGSGRVLTALSLPSLDAHAGPPHSGLDLQRQQNVKDAYFTKTVTCEMWAIFGRVATTYGYGPYNGYQCE